MKHTHKLWTLQFTAIVLMAFLFFLSLQLLTAGYPAYITDLTNNPARGGMMTTVFMIAAILTRPFISPIMLHVNLKKLSLLSLIFISITISLGYGQESVFQLFVLRFLHGVGFGIISTILSTVATMIIPRKRIGEGIGYYGLATSVGTSLAPMLAVSILQFFSYNLMIIITVLLTIATVILSFYMQVPASPAQNNAQRTFKDYVFDKSALVPCLLVTLFTVSLGGVLSFLNELGKEAGIMESVPLFFLIIAIIMTLVRPISGRVFDSYGHKVIIIPATLSGIIGLFLLAITHSTLTLLMAGFFYGLAYGVMTPTLQALAVSSVSLEKQGTANAMFFSSMDLGIALGSASLGLLATFSGYHFIYGISILSLVALLFTYTVVFFKGKKQSELAGEAS
ncbi:MFS transporter [Pseudalkalibacillus sp. A8]|uniref:MFS transporter n=1 Tax=Pseudalkalibacillus sp. A8 TaxID=3382641 RepID=UPI0038B5BACB